MSTVTSASPTRRDPELIGQTVVVIGGSAGIGLETARRARAEGANVILTARNPERLQQAASELDALSAAAFEATDAPSLERFFRDLPTPIDHIMVTAGRTPRASSTWTSRRRAGSSTSTSCCPCRSPAMLPTR
jgi:NADP-dependent 3-hydroxy acid dehydrogenase YdfG